jgi:hypothetical protein
VFYLFFYFSFAFFGNIFLLVFVYFLTSYSCFFLYLFFTFSF